MLLFFSPSPPFPTLQSAFLFVYNNNIKIIAINYMYIYKNNKCKINKIKIIAFKKIMLIFSLNKNLFFIKYNIQNIYVYIYINICFIFILFSLKRI